MFGILTTTTDYRLDPKIFDINDPLAFSYKPGQNDENNRYWLRKAIIKAYRKSGVPAREAEKIATRNLDTLLEKAKQPGLVEAPAAEENEPSQGGDHAPNRRN